MNKNDFMQIVKEASTDKRRVKLFFNRPVSICIHGKWQPKTKTYTLRFFELFDENKVVTGYGYKQRSNEVRGYSINNIPYDSLVSVEYPDGNHDDEHEREVFKKWALRNLDDGVWPELVTNIDSILSCLKHGEMTRVYVKSFAFQHEMDLVEEMFKERRSGTVILSKRDNVFVETSQRETGFYAWLVVGERSWTMLNPKIAILARK
jgi:hypothetical protein